MAETINPVSSYIPSVKAAEKPMMDQSIGTITITQGGRNFENTNSPRVKIVVGQGRPKVGAYGYTWPEKCPIKGYSTKA